MSPVWAFVLFAFSAMISPGPNNLMVMHSSLNFGIKRTLKHALGIFFGVITIFLLVGLGLGYFIVTYPVIKMVIKILGSFYMLYLAVKISQMNENKSHTNVSKPLTFLGAAFFQWVNPKAWVIAITLSGMFDSNGHGIYLNTLYLIIMVTLINIPCLFLWMGFGKGIEKIIKNKKQRKLFNLCLGLLLALSVVILWI